MNNLEEKFYYSKIFYCAPLFLLLGLAISIYLYSPTLFNDLINLEYPKSLFSGSICFLLLNKYFFDKIKRNILKDAIEASNFKEKVKNRNHLKIIKRKS